MTQRDTDHATAATTATETHREPHGAAAPHGVADDAGAHGGHGGTPEDPLGPVDVAAWGAGALGIVLGLVVAACFLVATVTRPA